MQTNQAPPLDSELPTSRIQCMNSYAETKPTSIDSHQSINQDQNSLGQLNQSSPSNTK